MKSISFRDGLIVNRYSNSNTYVFEDLVSIPTLFDKTCNEIPYLLYDKDISTGFIRIQYSATPQFRGRTITLSKMKEIVDSAKHPIMVRNCNNQYLMGKGFIAIQEASKVKYLFVACIELGKKITSMSQIKLYISKEVYKIKYKSIFGMIKEFMVAHSGDVIITNDIDKYIGTKIDFPIFKTLKERKNYMDKLIEESLEQFRK